MAKLKYNPMKTVRWFETADHLKIYAYLPWDTYYTPVRNAIAETLTDKNIPHKSLREVDLPFTQEETKQCYVITVDKEDF